MPRANPWPFRVVRVDVNYDAVPHRLTLFGRQRIEGSPQGNTRSIYADLSLADARLLRAELDDAIQIVERAT